MIHFLLIKVLKKLLACLIKQSILVFSMEVKAEILYDTYISLDLNIRVHASNIVLVVLGYFNPKIVHIVPLMKINLRLNSSYCYCDLKLNVHFQETKYVILHMQCGATKSGAGDTALKFTEILHD